MSTAGHTRGHGDGFVLTVIIDLTAVARGDQASPTAGHGARMFACGYPMPPPEVGNIVVSPLMSAKTTLTSWLNGIAEAPIVVSGNDSGARRVYFGLSGDWSS